MSFRLPHEDNPLDAPPLADMASILVVDEDPAFQLGLKTFLREYVGFEKVFTARSGQEALDFIRAEPSIEVVTLDYRMPVMNGIEMLASLRAQADRPVALIMITGQPSDELKSEFLAQGNDFVITTHFLTKPVQFERLEPIVLAAHEEVIAAKRRLREKEASGSGQGIAEALVTSPDLVGRLDAQGERLAALEAELRAQRGKWRGDFWKVAFVLFLFWLAGQFGLVQKVEPHWAEAKAAVWHQVDLWKANREAAARKATGPGEAPANPAPANSAPGAPDAQDAQDAQETEPSTAVSATPAPAESR
jgi:CheY-like chemotaxis protein